MAEFRRGFKAWSERTALGFRRDLQIEPFGALDPYELARYLNILVWTPCDVARLGDLAQVHLDQLLKHDPSSWSAVTLILPLKKVIVLNSSHTRVRQNSDLMHELAHLILEHKPARVDMTSNKWMILDTYDKFQEEEANWLGGALLVPRDALLEVLLHNRRNENAASHFNVSAQMIEWRRRMTGIDKQLSRRRSG